MAEHTEQEQVVRVLSQVSTLLIRTVAIGLERFLNAVGSDDDHLMLAERLSRSVDTTPDATPANEMDA